MISVIVPAREHTRSPIAECVAALVASRLSDKEIIVVDNGSTAEAMDAARGYGVPVMPNTHLDAGCAGPRNVGAEKAAGDLLVFVDSDVIIEAGALERIVEIFATESPSALFGVESADPGFGNFSSVYRNLWMRFSLLRLPRRAELLHSSCMAIRSEAFRAVGGFDERFRECSLEDVELGRRIVAAGGVILRDEAIGFQHRKRYDLRSLLSTERSRAAVIVAWQLRAMREHAPNASRALTVPPAHRYGLLVFAASLILLCGGLATRDVTLCLLAVTGVFIAVGLRADFLLFLARSQRWPFAARSALFVVADYLAVLLGALQGIARGLAGSR